MSALQHVKRRLPTYCTSKKSVTSKKAIVKKKVEIQGGGQEMTIMVLYIGY